VNSPLRAALGSVLVTIGVAICTLETSIRRGDQTMETDSSLRSFLGNNLEL
jgi:hypothetical protein